MNITRTWQSKSQTDNSMFMAWFQDLLACYQRERHFLRNNTFHSTSALQIRKYLLAKNLKGSDSVLRTIILDAMMSSNQLALGSDVWVPMFLSDKPIVLDKGYASSDEYVSWCEGYTDSLQVKSLFRSTIELCGPLTGISVRLGEYTEPFVRYKSSYSFPINPCPMFIQTVGKAAGFEIFNPEIFMIEGAPATLSEIEGLIYRHVESQRPIVLIARHFPEEVSATLATNWRNGKLKILPIVYGEDLSSINLAADIIAVAGGELVSTAFGDVITGAIGNEDKYGSANRIEYTGKTLDIDSDRDVSRHRRALLDALEGADEALQEILSNRVHSITNDSIEVNIPKSDSKLHEELDMMFKHYSAFVQTGYTKLETGLLPSNIVRVASAIADTTNIELQKIGGFLLESTYVESMDQE